MPVFTTAEVATDRPARYGKQLVAHMTRKCPGGWDEAASTGTLELRSAHVAMSCTDTALVITIDGPLEDADTLEDVVGRHLVRFGQRDELRVDWVRSDGSPGTSQVKKED